MSYKLYFLSLMPLTLAKPSPCLLNGLFMDSGTHRAHYNLTTQATTPGVTHVIPLIGAGWDTATCQRDGMEIACKFYTKDKVTSAVNGTVKSDCSAIEGWTNGAPAWARYVPPPPEPEVKRIHVVYMTHLDLGFTGSSRFKVFQLALAEYHYHLISFSQANTITACACRHNKKCCGHLL